ncbi:GNAT family N-acetyltransferase [Qipengyuania nanhaisediminis]|uniref:GNAT family N-acetyltransferase n=1 Tax=Qipengyuania nanhaisediminis TaxID=604088 RepID=UPI0038B2DBD2
MNAGLRVFDRIDPAMTDAGTALSRARQSSMFDRADWFSVAARHATDGDPLIIRGEENGSRCWLFLARKGGSATALSNWYCLHYRVVTEGENPPYDQLAEGLRAAKIHHLRIDPIDDEAELAAALKQRGWLVRREQTDVSWRVDVEGMSFDEFWSGRPSRLRNTAKRKARKAKLACKVFNHLDAALWTEVCEVFENSWNNRANSPDLTHDVFRHEADAGTLRLGMAYKDGRPVAAQVWTIEHGVAIIHLLSYREDVSKLGAGTILTRHMFEHVLDNEDVRTIDFGIGDHAYKREWMSYRVPLHTLSAYYALSLPGLVAIAGMVLRKLSGLLGRGGAPKETRRHARRS